MVLMVLRLHYNVWILKAFYIFRLLEVLPRLYSGGVYPPPGVSLWASAASRTQPNQSKEHTNKPQTEKPGSDQRQAADHESQPKDIIKEPTLSTMGDPATAHPAKEKHRQRIRQRWTCTRLGKLLPAYKNGLRSLCWCVLRNQQKINSL